MSHSRRRAQTLVGGVIPDHVLTHTTSSDPMIRLGRRVVIMGDCWVVNGEPDKYHQLESGRGQMQAHRFVYQEVTGDVLDSGVHVHHTCEVKGCIRPDHLEALTASDHMSHHGAKVSAERRAYWAEQSRQQ